MSKNKTVILGVTASIAIYKACEIVRRLNDEGYRVEVVMTEDAMQMIRPVVFQSLSGNKVHQGMFEDVASWEIGHVSLAGKAGLLLIAPATANIIAKLAAGICDDLLSCVALATRAPVMVCPAMNENMYLNKITQENIEKLNHLGFKFVAPKQGKLACGKTGLGCLAEVEKIIAEVKKIL